MQENDRSEQSEKPRSRRLKTGFIVTVSILLIFSIGFLLWNSSITSPDAGKQSNVEKPKAAILDGLYITYPNLTVIQSLTNFLSAAGYQVDVFKGENVTIDLLRNVGGYKVLVLRLHSAIHIDGFLYLFSGENYSASKYAGDQSVRKGVTFEGEEYLAINSVFLGANKPTGLKDSTVILTGCNGTGDSYSIQRLLEKGVRVYVAWTGYVDLSHSDEATLALAKALYLEKLGVREAVEEVMREVGPDPLYKSVLEYRLSQG